MTSEHFFEILSDQFNSKLPFVAYRKPNSTIVKTMLQFDDYLHKIEDFTESGFICAPFEDSEAAVLIPDENSDSFEVEYQAKNETIGSFDDFTIEGEKQKHIELVQKGLDAIHANKFTKVVLSRREDTSLLETNPVTIFRQLLQQYDAAFVYCWFHPKVGLWLGATPETLLKIEGNTFSSMALAGTQEYNGTINVTWFDKDIDEQKIVIDDIVKRISTVIDNLNISKTESVKAGPLLHLKTKFKGVYNTKRSTLKELIEKLHPTPAVCGFPREMAKTFILENEDYKRQFYTGYLGEMNLKLKTGRNRNSRNIENNVYASIKNTTELFVNLRCMQLEGDKAILYVGGGITKDSIPEKEWVETVNKTKTMKRVIGY